MGFFDIFKKSDNSAKHEETFWSVGIINQTVILKNPDGKGVSFSIDDIQKIIIETTDEGPIHPDVWWKISTSTETYVFPSGCNGEDILLQEVQKFPNFNNEEFIKAMCCAENNEFVCWIK